MRDVLTALAKLWKIDEAAKGYDEELRSLPAKMEAMRSDVRMLESLLTSERAQVEQADALTASRISELQERREALARAKSKAARARNLKEADAVDREIEATRRLMADREREIAQLGTTVEAKRETLAEREKQLGEALALADEETKAGEARLAEVREARLSVVVGRDELVAVLPRRVIKRYEKLRARDKYLPVSTIAEPTCVSCRMAIPAQLFIEIKRADATAGPVDVEDLPVCPHCHAFLVHRDLIDPPPPEG